MLTTLYVDYADMLYAVLLVTAGVSDEKAEDQRRYGDGHEAAAYPGCGAAESQDVAECSRACSCGATVKWPATSCLVATDHEPGHVGKKGCAVSMFVTPLC